MATTDFILRSSGVEQLHSTSSGRLALPSPFFFLSRPPETLWHSLPVAFHFASVAFSLLLLLLMLLMLRSLPDAVCSFLFFLSALSSSLIPFVYSTLAVVQRDLFWLVEKDMSCWSVEDFGWTSAAKRADEDDDPPVYRLWLMANRQCTRRWCQWTRIEASNNWIETTFHWTRFAAVASLQLDSRKASLVQTELNQIQFHISEPLEKRSIVHISSL